MVSCFTQLIYVYSSPPKAASKWFSYNSRSKNSNGFCVGNKGEAHVTFEAGLINVSPSSLSAEIIGKQIGKQCEAFNSELDLDYSKCNACRSLAKAKLLFEITTNAWFLKIYDPKWNAQRSKSRCR